MNIQNIKYLLCSYRALFLLFFTCFLICIHRRKEKFHTDIVLIRTDALGDFIVSLPIMKQIHDIAMSRGQKVTGLVSETMAEFAERCNCFDTVISVPPRQKMASFRTRLDIYRKVAAIHADTLVNMLFFGRCAIEDYFSYFIHAKRKLVTENMQAFPLFPGVEPFRKITNFIYNEKPSYFSQKTLLENEATLASIAMNTKIDAVLGDLDFLFPFSDPQCAVPYYMIIPGGSDSKKQWEPEKIAAVINAVADIHPDLIPLISGVNADQVIVEKITKHIKKTENVLNLCGKTSLLQLIGNVSGAMFVVTNDTGPLHIAAKVHKQTFCIIGRGHWGAYNPNPLYKTVKYFSGECDTPCCSWMCRQGNETPYPCVCAISFYNVISAIESFLKKREAHG